MNVDKYKISYPWKPYALLGFPEIIDNVEIHICLFKNINNMLAVIEVINMIYAYHHNLTDKFNKKIIKNLNINTFPWKVIDYKEIVDKDNSHIGLARTKDDADAICEFLNIFVKYGYHQLDKS